MPKQGGMGDNFYLAGYDLSADINSLSRVGGGPATLPATNITQSGEARMGGVRSGGIGFVSYWNPGPEANAAHTVLSALPTADVIASYFRGTVVGNPAASMTAKQAGYDPARGQDGSLLFTVDTQSNGFGLEWGVELTAGIRTETGPVNSGTSVDNGASTAFGAQVYLQAFAFAGTSATVNVQDSPDNITFTLVTGLSFAVTVAPAAIRQATANTATINRYVRIAVPFGTFTSLQFAAVLVRNPIAGQVF